MATVESRQPLQPGERAPDFTLPAVDRGGSVSLADYRGKSPLLLALYRGVYCPTCRRAIARLGTMRDKLEALGVKPLGVVATSLENARLYLRYHPTRLTLAVDQELATHRAYGVPMPARTTELMQALQTVRVNPTGELPEPVSIMDLIPTLNRLDGYTPTVTDQSDMQRPVGQLVGKFLIDRDGVVRWVYIEGAREGLAGVGKFPTEEELLAIARTLGT